MSRAKASTTDFYVYVLCDPRKPLDLRDGTEPLYFPDLDLWLNYEPFYVGKGYGNRCTDHLRYAHNIEGKHYNTYKSRKIRSIEKSGYDIVIIKSSNPMTDASAISAEKSIIAKVGRKDLKRGPLLNHTDGGDGISGRVTSQATRDKLRRLNKGRVVSEETRRKISEAKKGKRLSEEHKRKLSIAGTGRVVSSETRAKKSAALKGRKHTPEQIEKNRLGHLGIKESDETRRRKSIAHMGLARSEYSKLKQSASTKGRKMTPEQIEKNRASHVGQKVSKETRQRQSEAHKERWALKKLLNM